MQRMNGLTVNYLLLLLNELLSIMYNYCTTYSAPFRSFKSIILTVRFADWLWIYTHYLIPAGWMDMGRDWWSSRREVWKVKMCWLLLHTITQHSSNPYYTLSAREMRTWWKKLGAAAMTIKKLLSHTSKCLLAGHNTLRKDQLWATKSR